MEQKGLMTEGSIFKHLLYFSIPLLIGNLFQQLYNTFDSIVVGKFIGDNALAAVNSSTAVIFFIVSLCVGLSMGASVLIANKYGARDEKGVFHGVHTSFALTILCAIFVTFVGALVAPLLLRYMNVNEDIIGDSTLYLRTYFLGNGGLVIYNMCSGVLRAVGDSKHPLYYLILASIINIVLDITFVAYFHLGIFGVALATGIAQYISGFLTILQLTRAKDMYQLHIHKIHIHKESCIKIVKIGLPSAFQNAIVSISNVVVQSNINAFGTSAMAGCGSYSKIDGFAILPCMSFSNALTTFVGQNIGAGKMDRVKKGSRIGMGMSVATTLCITILLLTFAPQLLSIFSNTEDVLQYGILMLHTVSPFYIILCLSHNLSGILRGAGKTQVPMYIMISTWCLCRMAWITIMIKIYHDIRFVFLGWPVTWILSTVLLFIYYKKADWMHQI